MILVDTSAWIEFLRATGSSTHYRVRDLLAQEEAPATPEVVVMEVLAGARDEAPRLELRRLMLGCELPPPRRLPMTRPQPTCIECVDARATPSGD
jgi:predicted nucleic acid-binding protein